MSLHVETLGTGEPLVLLHGWGMHGGMWGSVVDTLAQDFCVHLVDLPGHGKAGKGEGGRENGNCGSVVLPFPLPSSPFPDCPFSLPPSPFSIDSIVAELAAHFSAPLTVCGWSLGGQIAQHWAASEPDKIQRLILVASTPCFAQRDDWQHGMLLATLQQFAQELERDYAATLRRFLALQVRGSEGERELLQSLRAALFSRGEPHLDALRGGLEILRDADLRAALPHLSQPTLVIAGERDKLTPPAASHFMATALPNAQMLEIQGAAHAPFLSHPDLFMQHLLKFLQQG
jgi:pimeloyl-[acyl-carrier protein] methyl ester esterase